jgi:hypothetical protein
MAEPTPRSRLLAAVSVARCTIRKGTALSAPVSNLGWQRERRTPSDRPPGVDPARRGRGRNRPVREGSLHGGLPYLAVGEGPPLVVFSGLTAEHANPTGLARRLALLTLRPMARHFTVSSVNRKPGLPPGTSIGDLAGHYADAIAHQ